MGKAKADQGAQAAIGDIINNVGISGLIGHVSGTVVIHINTAPGSGETPIPAGLIVYFGLDDWWLSELSAVDRAIIEDAIGPEVSRNTITSSSRSAPAWLRGIAWRISVVHPQLASRLRAKATGLETGTPVDDYWQRQLDAVRRHWQRLDFKTARDELRAVGYRMREENALPDAHADFAQLQAALLRADPYYTDVMQVALPIIAGRPGVVQAVLAKGTGFDAEQFRHAMYYGEIIGDIKRVKQGRSYCLFAGK